MPIETHKRKTQLELITDGQKQTVRRLWDSGVSIREMMRTLGWSQPKVRRVVAAMELTKRDSPIGVKGDPDRASRRAYYERLEQIKRCYPRVDGAIPGSVSTLPPLASLQEVTA